MSKSTNRKFTKKLVVLNILAAWVVLVVSMPLKLVEDLIIHILAFITSMVAIYAGVGHLDYRKFVERENNAQGES